MIGFQKSFQKYCLNRKHLLRVRKMKEKSKTTSEKTMADVLYCVGQKINQLLSLQSFEQMLGIENIQTDK